ncbi:MAG: protein translocase subunit SecF [Methanobacterium sp.]|jgi:preprotein translocase subunit SecF
MKIEQIIEGSYKPLIVIPVIITLIAIAIIAFNGLEWGIELEGGTITTLSLERPIDQFELKSMIERGLNTDEVTINSFNGTTAIVTIGGATDVTVFSNLMNGTATVERFNSVGPALSAEALNQIYWAVAIAFIFMSITVFIMFRNFVPSIAVILAGLSDIIIAVGGMSLFGIPVTLASVGALLLLIGYSVDTDILLATRILKRKKGTVTERALGTMKTGLTMAAAAIGSMVTLYIVTVFFIPAAEVLSDIAAVLIIGLISDIMATWLMNLGILRWYMERGRR